MLRSCLCDYSDAYVLVKRTIAITKEKCSTKQFQKKVIIKNSASFINYMSRISKTQVDDASDIDAVMPMYN